MQKLNFSSYKFRLTKRKNQTYIFDPIRKKFVQLTPEEWVRQHILQYLILEKKIPICLINVEKQIMVFDIPKRYDIVVFKTDGSYFLLVECKAPEISITQNTFDQIAQYNLKIQAQYLMVSNGLKHYFCTIDVLQNKYNFLKDLPQFNF